MAGIIPPFLTEETLGVVNWVWLAGIVLLASYIMKVKPKDKYKNIPIKKVVNDNLTERFKFNRISEGMATKLYVGSHKIGYVLAYSSVLWRFDIDTVSGKIVIPAIKKVVESEQFVDIEIIDGKPVVVKPEQQKKNEKLKAVLKEFYLMKVGKDDIIGTVKGFLGMGHQWVLVDKQFINRYGSDFTINPQVQYKPYLNILIFSEYGKTFITDISSSKQLELTLESQINYLPKQAFLDTQTNKNVSLIRERTDQEKEKYKSRVDV